MKEEKLKVLSLFSGIGAFEKALTNLSIDYELVGFSEIDKWAIKSYCAIHSVGEDLNLGDVSKIKNEDMPSADLVTYGFPCQDISVAGLQKGIKEGTRSGLLYEAERVIKTIKPRYAIAENVKNLVGKKHKKDFEELLERLDEYGYNNYWKVLNTKDFGIPQNRERVFIVSIRKDIDNGIFEFPKSIELEIRLKDMLNDEVEKKYFLDKYVEKFKLGNNNFKENQINVAGSIEQKGWYRLMKVVLDTKGICTTLNTSQGGNIEPKIKVEGINKIRKITPLECWRLMDFKDEDYWKARRKLEEIFYNGNDRSDSQMYKQAGNSISVNVLEAIFKELFKEKINE